MFDPEDSEIKAAPVEGTTADLLDKLVAIQLALRPLCDRDVALPSETRRSFEDGCEILQSVIAELVVKLRSATVAIKPPTEVPAVTKT